MVEPSTYAGIFGLLGWIADRAPTVIQGFLGGMGFALAWWILTKRGKK